MEKRTPLIVTLMFLFTFISSPLLCDPLAAQSAEILQNGSFETGDFTDWTAQTTGFTTIPWRVTGAGQLGGSGMIATEPQEGALVAWNAFDGGGPMNFNLFQDVAIPADSVATLSWSHRIQWNFSIGRPALLPRTFDVLVRDPTSGAVLEVLLTFETGIQSTTPTGDTGWVQNSNDLSAYAGQTVRLEFVEYIPEVLTGYGQFEIDQVSVLAEEPVATDPPVDTSIDIDIRPWNCPNRLILKSRGYLPVAILGTADLDINSIDPESISLAGVSAKRTFQWDIASPVEDSETEGECKECRRTRRDGYKDIFLLFRTQDVVKALREQYGEELKEIDCLNLELSCSTFEGDSLSGEDSVKIVAKKRRHWGWWRRR